MSLPYGLLGLLSYQDGTGYDMAKMFEGSLNFFWHAQSSQIYREFSRMEEKGWVSCESIVQDGRPNKKVYSITESGRDEFTRWLSEAEFELVSPHNSMLMRVFFGANDPDATLLLLKKVRDQCKKDIATKHPEASQNASAYAEITKDGQLQQKYWLMTRDFVTMQKKATIEWVERCIAHLEGKIGEDELKNATDFGHMLEGENEKL